MFLSKNLKYLRERNNRQTQENLADALGITRSAVSSYEDGRAEPKLVVMNRIAQYFNITLDQLLNVDLSRMREEDIARQREVSKYASAHNLRILTITVDKENNENVELVPEKARAGYTTGYSDPNYLSNLPKYQLPFLPQGKTYRAFEITGDSMLPLLPNTIVIGEYVTNWTDLRDGQTCIVVSKNEGIVLKKVYNRIKDRATLLLKSTNIQYRPYEIPAEEVLEIWKFSAYISRELPEEVHSYHELREAFDRLEEEVQELKTFTKAKA
ncbi:XRE family transcriptional regulator [Eisenibacter elegans]|jgi:transcriptional regulator with XRE-family HTH domain|uniref:XRE family transcriptional regulator n=1 Tax=Eisenibacter elegans TaxID=997 RepID=UPI0003F68B68|nr:LexA family transcriptional regulator [Eisenibacter elegans]